MAEDKKTECVADKNEKMSEKRYENLINARNFHYENFNKWLTFFYVAVGTIFVGYYSDGIESVPQGRLLLNILGIITSLMLYWSGKGYYYWEINWIMLIHDYEKRFPDTEKVYACFANKSASNDYFSVTKGANISTSKISLTFSFMLAVVWVFLLLNSLLQKHFSIPVYICISIIFVEILGLIPKLFFKSDLQNLVDLKL